MPPIWTFGVFEVRARARVSLERGDVRYAAMNGHLECLKYAHEHGCPWDEEDVRSMPPERTFGVFEVRARARVSLETSGRAVGPPIMDIWSV